jgi:hypothetical protein
MKGYNYVVAKPWWSDCISYIYEIYTSCINIDENRLLYYRIDTLIDIVRHGKKDDYSKKNETQINRMSLLFGIYNKNDATMELYLNNSGYSPEYIQKEMKKFTNRDAYGKSSVKITKIVDDYYDMPNIVMTKNEDNSVSFDKEYTDYDERYISEEEFIKFVDLPEIYNIIKNNISFSSEQNVYEKYVIDKISKLLNIDTENNIDNINKNITYEYIQNDDWWKYGSNHKEKPLCPCDFWYNTYCNHNYDCNVSAPLSEIHGIYKIN